ncbi:hypothetical protein [Zobellella maritima]|uniref:hypothetical protein n=1 Tax=Zobellella maritima TaxID=2059725 RepID=UPI001300B4FE|nr:hypothetical protein [Zobellella maritima]
MKYCLLSLLLSLPAAADTLSQRVDDSGVSHLSDVPHPHTERASDHQQAAGIAVGSSPMAAAPPLPITNYRVTFNSPRDGDTLCSQQGNVSLSAALDPLPEYYQLELWLDGQAAARVSNSPRLTLENLASEQYQAFFKLLDKNGKFLAESSTITFYLRRARVGQASQAAP